MEYYIKLMKILLSGVKISIEIFAITIIFAIPLGILISVISKNKKSLITKTLNIYILIMRGTPLLLQIICIYFAPYYLFGISYNRFIAVCLAFILNYAAYFGEIFRGGIESVSIGQWEAAFTLGFNKAKTFFIIILPQVIKKVLPPLSNEIITLIRDTSLAQVIGITELFSLAQKQANYKFSIIPLLLAGGIYLIISTALTFGFKTAERKLDYYR